MMTNWFTKNLGDAMLAGEELEQIKTLFLADYEKAGQPQGMAVFMRHESADLHCEVKVYFPPAAAAVAKMLNARPCPPPATGDLGLLAGADA